MFKSIFLLYLSVLLIFAKSKHHKKHKDGESAHTLCIKIDTIDMKKFSSYFQYSAPSLQVTVIPTDGNDKSENKKGKKKSSSKKDNNSDDDSKIISGIVLYDPNPKLDLDNGNYDNVLCWNKPNFDSVKIRVSMFENFHDAYVGEGNININYDDVFDDSKKKNKKKSPHVKNIELKNLPGQYGNAYVDVSYELIENYDSKNHKSSKTLIVEGKQQQQQQEEEENVVVSDDNYGNSEKQTTLQPSNNNNNHDNKNNKKEKKEAKKEQKDEKKEAKKEDKKDKKKSKKNKKNSQTQTQSPKEDVVVDPSNDQKQEQQQQQGAIHAKNHRHHNKHNNNNETISSDTSFISKAESIGFEAFMIIAASISSIIGFIVLMVIVYWGYKTYNRQDYEKIAKNFDDNGSSKKNKRKKISLRSALQAITIQQRFNNNNNNDDENEAMKQAINVNSNQHDYHSRDTQVLP